MELVNESKAIAEWTLGFQKDGREFVCLVAKITFNIPPDREEASLAAEQLPMTQADEFTGEPGLSAIIHESDFAHEKPQCDVLVNGSVYAPGGILSKRVCVGLLVGPIKKRFEVLGDRFWDRRITRVSPTPPQPFTHKRISYDIAYGGTSFLENEPIKIRAYPDNPIGQGFYPLEKRGSVIGKPLANTQEIGKPATNLDGNYQPMAFGPLGRNFKKRAAFLGTYDKSWLEKRAPFLPDDFDYRYFQAAPADQQMPYPQLPLDITLENLTVDGLRRFRVPYIQIPVLVFQHDQNPQEYNFNIDTILIEPDFDRVALIYRLRIPLRKNLFDLSRIVLGQTYKQYHRSVIRQQKVYYKNLDEMVKAKRKGKVT